MGDELTRKELRKVSAAMENLAKAMKLTTEAEIKSKNRVDISLAEYEALKKRIAELQEKCEHYELVFARFQIPPKVIERIDSRTVRKAVTRDLKDFTSRVTIEFDVNDHELGDI